MQMEDYSKTKVSNVMKTSLSELYSKSDPFLRVRILKYDVNISKSAMF